jgi:hypothetical protein
LFWKNARKIDELKKIITLFIDLATHETIGSR